MSNAHDYVLHNARRLRPYTRAAGPGAFGRGRRLALDLGQHVLDGPALVEERMYLLLGNAPRKASFT